MRLRFQTNIKTQSNQRSQFHWQVYIWCPFLVFDGGPLKIDRHQG